MTESISVEWDAKEYILKEKNAGWYIGMAVVAIILCAIAIIIKQWMFIAVVILCVICVVIYSVRPPRTMHYIINSQGLKEGEKLYSFADFKSFGILKEDNNYCIVLMPVKRFGLRLKVYFPEKQGEQIVDAFGKRLPMSEIKLDFLDKIVNFLRI